MKSPLHIGANITKKTQKNLIKDLIKIIKAGHKYGCTSETTIHAMDCLIKIAEVKNISITNCNFTA